MGCLGLRKGGGAGVRDPQFWIKVTNVISISFLCSSHYYVYLCMHCTAFTECFEACTYTPPWDLWDRGGWSEVFSPQPSGLLNGLHYQLQDPITLNIPNISYADP